MRKSSPRTMARAREMLMILFVTLIMVTGIHHNVQAQSQSTFTADQLKNLVAPVALYPDQLLAYVLTASTMPDEVIQASNYLSAQGGSVTTMPDNDWDPSVKALLNFPSALNKMNGNLLWTRSLGQAVILQQPDVLKAIQTYRASALSSGSLQSNQYQNVVDSDQTIQIQPTSPQVVYVPTYDTTTPAGLAAPLVTFGAGVAVGSWWNYRNCNWGAGNITVNPTYFNYYNYHPGSTYYNTWGVHPNTVWAPTAAAVNGCHYYGGAGAYYRPGEAAATPYAGSLDNSLCHGLEGGYHYGGATYHAGDTYHAGGATYHEGETYHAGGATYHEGETFHTGGAWDTNRGWADSAAGYRGGASRYGGGARGGFRR